MSQSISHTSLWEIDCDIGQTFHQLGICSSQHLRQYIFRLGMSWPPSSRSYQNDSENVFWEHKVQFDESITKTGMVYELTFCLH